MPTESLIHDVSWPAWRAWFEAEVTRVHADQSGAPLAEIIGPGLADAIERCESDDIMPGETRLKLYGLAIDAGLDNLRCAPFTYRQGCKLLRDCLATEQGASLSYSN